MTDRAAPTDPARSASWPPPTVGPAARPGGAGRSDRRTARQRTARRLWWLTVPWLLLGGLYTAPLLDGDAGLYVLFPVAVLAAGLLGAGAATLAGRDRRVPRSAAWAVTIAAIGGPAYLCTRVPAASRDLTAPSQVAFYLILAVVAAWMLAIARLVWAASRA